MTTIKKYWAAFAVLIILAVIGAYWFYFRKKKPTATITKPSGAGSDSPNPSIIKSDGIEMGTIVYDSGIAGMTFNHGGRSSGANITKSVNLSNIALKDAYSYSIEQYTSPGEESTEIKLFLNGELVDWVSIDWVIERYAHIPVENYTPPGGGVKDEQQQAESNTGKELYARYSHR